jgi:ribonuclease G
MEDMGEIVTGKQEAIRKMAVPVSVGDVIEVEIKEQHASNPANGITRIDGYILDIDGAGGIVGKRILVEIRKVFRTYAKGKPVETKEDENVTPAVDSKSPTNMVIAGDGHV